MCLLSANSSWPCTEVFSLLPSLPKSMSVWVHIRSLSLTRFLFFAFPPKSSLFPFFYPPLLLNLHFCAEAENVVGGAYFGRRGIEESPQLLGHMLKFNKLPAYSISEPLKTDDDHFLWFSVAFSVAVAHPCINLNALCPALSLLPHPSHFAIFLLSLVPWFLSLSSLHFYALSVQKCSI